MAMSIIIGSDETQWSIGQEKSWNIGCKPPIGINEVPKITWIQLDGDELNNVMSIFPNLLYVDHKRCQRFYGEMAQHIVGNILF